MEQASQTQTIVEKFEHYAEDIDLVFVLATGDDVGGLARERDKSQKRARQNVIFELGYFLGLLKRTSGKVILLHEKGVELPSNLSGVVHIDIANGVFQAREEIVREIAGWIS